MSHDPGLVSYSTIGPFWTYQEGVQVMTNEIMVIPNDCAVQYIRYTPNFSGFCSVGQAPFWGLCEIEYHPQDVLLEFESFETWLRSLHETPMTIEQATRTVFEELSRVLGDISLRVVLHARTTVHAPVSASLESERWRKRQHGQITIPSNGG